MTSDSKLVDFFFELNSLNRLQRTGFGFLGAGGESVAAHSFQVAALTWAMGALQPDVDTERLMLMGLFHDLAESRTGDLNLVQKQYTQTDERRAAADICQTLPFGETIAQALAEYAEGESVEARLVHDADQLALLLELKQMIDVGYETPRHWIEPVCARLRTSLGRGLARTILEGHKDHWWMRLLDLPAHSDKHIDT
jgi:putative hydrolase of HD superfamily